ncbi:antitoxin Xre-like helix-turn-helix domain-containing protein [Deinococcus kurensis]|uniref:antitoxin Xre-like helix-turn-helix domain-containing protein n=1 Tax=Deinococcus kurensis TaxID=2662757 RepID=UPI002805EBDB|nr:antitoxin Xre-like helix-turn-helix domain-containing protein [Deinococcus kurensis]
MPERSPHAPTSTTRSLAAVTRLLTRWGLPHAQQAHLLGFTNRALRRAQREAAPTLSLDQQDRLRLLSAILSALLTLYSPRTVGGWLPRRNDRTPFHGQRPLDVLLTGGLPALRATWHLLAGDLSGQFGATPASRQQASRLPQPPINLD